MKEGHKAETTHLQFHINPVLLTEIKLRESELWLPAEMHRFHFLKNIKAL